jgi:hypothetical protein
MGTELIVASRFCAVTMISPSDDRLRVAGASVRGAADAGGCWAAWGLWGSEVEGTAAVCADAGENDSKYASGSADALRMNFMRDIKFPLLTATPDAFLAFYRRMACFVVCAGDVLAC